MLINKQYEILQNVILKLKILTNVESIAESKKFYLKTITFDYDVNIYKNLCKKLNPLQFKNIKRLSAYFVINNHTNILKNSRIKKRN